MRRADTVLAAVVLAMVSFAGAALAATGAPDGFLSWPWGRHHSVFY